MGVVLARALSLSLFARTQAQGGDASFNFPFSLWLALYMTRRAMHAVPPLAPLLHISLLSFLCSAAREEGGGKEGAPLSPHPFRDDFLLFFPIAVRARERAVAGVAHRDPPNPGESIGLVRACVGGGYLWGRL